MCKVNCSKCCELMIVEIKEKVTEDYIRWAEYHYGVEVVDIKGHYFLKLDTPCRKLVEGQCSIHDTKPELCRAYDCEDPNYKEFKFLVE